MDNNNEYIDLSNSKQEKLIRESEVNLETGSLLDLLKPFESYCKLTNGLGLTVHATHDAWCYFSIGIEYLDGKPIEKIGSIQCLYLKQFLNAVETMFSKPAKYNLIEKINRIDESNTPDFFCDKSQGDWDLVYKSFVIPVDGWDDI